MGTCSVQRKIALLLCASTIGMFGNEVSNDIHVTFVGTCIVQSNHCGFGIDCVGVVILRIIACCGVAVAAAVVVNIVSSTQDRLNTRPTKISQLLQFGFLFWKLIVDKFDGFILVFDEGIMSLQLFLFRNL